MRISEQVRAAFHSLFHHKIRSCLTMLGMVFGVGAVIAMIAISQGARLEVMASISDLGADSILIQTKEPPVNQDQKNDNNAKPANGLTFRDCERILAAVPDLVSHVMVRDTTQQMPFNGRPPLPQMILATEPAYFTTAHLRQERGRFLCDLDGERRLPVAVIGAEMAKSHFPLQDPLGQMIHIKNATFKIVGVIKAIGATGPGGASADELNHAIFVAEPAARIYLGIRAVNRTGANSYNTTQHQVSQLVLHLKPDADVLTTGKYLRRLVLTAHPQGDAEVVVPLELLEQKRKTQRTFTIIMSSIASISLLVGGIGITNIMLASVLERTREIGIRRAVGARRRDILSQFLVETVLMSLLGGLAGIVLGIVVAIMVNHFAEWPIVITWWSVVLSVGIAVGVGLLSGVSPAITAARLLPVQALRHA
jgi:putative ABC transport system permease protein